MAVSAAERIPSFFENSHEILMLPFPMRMESRLPFHLLKCLVKFMKFWAAAESFFPFK